MPILPTHYTSSPPISQPLINRKKIFLHQKGKTTMSKIGYIRVSTEKQETARQQEIMCDYQAPPYLLRKAVRSKHRPPSAQGNA